MDRVDISVEQESEVTNVVEETEQVSSKEDTKSQRIPEPTTESDNKSSDDIDSYEARREARRKAREERRKKAAEEGNF